VLSRKFKQTVSGRTGPHGDRTTTRELHGGRTGAKQGRTGASRNYTGICLIALQDLQTRRMAFYDVKHVALSMARGQT